MDVKLTILHFSDYHSHAVPYFSEHRPAQGGIARAVAFLKQVRASEPNPLVLSGGDMVNLGTPAWSDKYGCAEWRWLDGLVDAMALGNHDLDYGWPAFQACQKGVKFPILSANLLDKDGAPLLGPGYVIKEIAGVRVGLFALSGPDFASLVKPANLPEGARFGATAAAVTEVLRRLRGDERADLVVFIGHQDQEADFEMARKFPGIDLILGSHSHLKADLQTIPGTQTAFISPYQYLNYVSRVDLTFSRDGARKIKDLRGALVRMDASIPEDAAIKAEVTAMQAALEKDPRYAERFLVIGQAAVELANDNIDRGESVLGNFAMDIVRGAGMAQVALSSASSFRAAIAPGDIRMEDYLTALPYKNKIVTFKMTGAQVQALLDFGVSKRGSDHFAVTSGVRYTIAGGKAAAVQVLQGGAYKPLDAAARYDVATTDYLAGIAAGYKDLFAQASAPTDSGKIVNDTLLSHIRAHSPVSAQLEGRITE
jgi:5'-nucleotidase